jgi:hypothetical protein
LDSSLISLMTNLGFGGAVIVLIIFGYLVPRPAYKRVVDESARKDLVIEKQQETIALERQRGDGIAQAGTVTNQLIGALTTLATEHRAAEKTEHADAANLAADARITPGIGALDLTGKDLGL